MPASQTTPFAHRHGNISEHMLSWAPNRPRSSARRWSFAERVNAFLRFGSALLFIFAPAARAQLSLAGAVGLSLHSNPRVLGARADVAKAQAQLSEVYDAYVPAITAGTGIGQAYGYTPNPPSAFFVNAGSLVYSAGQMAYLRSARAGVSAAQLALEDVREQVAQDTALAFISLDRDQQRQQAIDQQAAFAASLVTIVEQRVDAGQDSQIDLTQARLTAAQLRLAKLKAGDDVLSDRDHLARLIGVPSDSLSTDGNFPSSPVAAQADEETPAGGYASPAVASAFANAKAKQEAADGDARFHFRPQINLVAQYNFYATFTDSFAQLQKFNGGNIAPNEAAFGVQITIPILDKLHAARARQSAAEASHALSDAENAQIDALDGQTQARHAISELQAQAEVATLQQQLAQQQLDVIQLQLQSGNGNPEAPQMNPKDEQKARISERDKYLNVIDANFQLRQAMIQLLRQTGNLEAWLRTNSAAPSSPQNPLPPSPAPQH
jgi:outer membrane protein TolC